MVAKSAVVVAVINRMALAALLVLVGSVLAKAQTTPLDNYNMPPNKMDTEIDFLGNYYSQDGDLGAPQGGIGTEELTNLAAIVVVKVPLDSNKSIAVSAGLDSYSSASTDRIDYQLSTASSNDIRAYASVGYTHRDLAGGRTYTVKAGGSREYDYESINGAITVAQEWNRGQNELSATVQVFNDKWDLIYPLELRSPSAQFSRITDRGRESYGFSLAYARILTPRLQMSLNAELVLMRGLLSTPFHRIYFQGSVEPEEFVDENRRDFPADDIERLPDTRTKIPVSLRLNYKLGDAITLRGFGRYYADTWGIRSLTTMIETAYDVSRDWTVSGFWRFHTQQASDYYAGFAQHLGTEQFYTSDFDLAEFNTQKVGVGLRYAPVFGLARTRIFNRGLEWRQISLRGSYYQRNPSLEAYSVTFSTSLALRPKKRT